MPAAFCTPVWVVGFALLIGGSTLNIVALRFGNQLLLSSLASVSIVFSTVLSVWILKETWFKSDMLAIFLMCLGSVLFMLFAHNSKQDYTYDELQGLYLRIASITVYVAAAVITAGTYALDRRIRDELNQYMVQLRTTASVDQERQSNKLTAEDAGDMFQLNVLVKALFIVAAITGIRVTPETRSLVNRSRAPMVLLAFISALICSCQISITRGTTIVVGMQDSFSYIRTYLFLFMTIALAFVQLLTLNRGMELYPAIEMMPIYNTANILLNMFCGAVILDEQSMYTASELILLMFFSVICIAGIFILVRKIDFDNCGGTSSQQLELPRAQ